MIKEAIQYVVGLGNAKLEKVGEQTYATQPMHLVKEASPNVINVRSLSGLVEYLQSKFDGDEKIMVHVNNPIEVTCFSTLNRDKNRDHFIQATAMIPSFSFDRFIGSEEFNIKLQSSFVKSEDRDIVLKVVGNIQEDNVSTVGDDGVSQAVTIKTGVATVGNVKVPNPVVLKPYRTFVEVDQPASEFIFRMQKGPTCALFEADGGAWKLEAMKNIKTYLEENLKQEIDSGKVVVIA